ncbi:hypothetical protein QTI99_16015 [Clostridium perfringens]|uniref:hypothetical protein n=1 Tax=Clostridium perfringens TaxID=1502 RepID=UPI002ED3FD9D|nr:hypothetical protein [Clostridium perfringens]MDM0998960.1 hypothetical protein [Clostridium perfringens]WVM77717.1 hypothetical protein V1680_16725 [Clostridium perfringens]
MVKMNKFDRLVKALGGLKQLIELVNKYKVEGLNQDDITNNVIKEAKKADAEVNVSSSLLFKKIVEHGYGVVGGKYVLPTKLEPVKLDLDDYKFFMETDFNKDYTGKFNKELFEEFEKTIKALYPNQPTYKVLNLVVKEFLDKHNPNRL